MSRVLARVFLAVGLTSAPLFAQSTGTGAPTGAPAMSAPKNDYGSPDTWLCHPGKANDACAVDLATTVVAADGRLTREAWSANPKAPSIRHGDMLVTKGKTDV